MSSERRRYILETKDLTKAFGGLVAVNHVNIKVERNKMTMLMGPNGAGKTTFVNVCTGVLKPDEGEVIFDGRDITGWPPHDVYKAGFVRTFQVPEPFLKLTVLDNVLVAIGNKGENPFRGAIKWLWIREEKENIEKAFKILDAVGLADLWDRQAFTLGAGQLKMLEIARALATGAKLIALDEPIGGTDPAYANDILSYVKGLLKIWDVSFLLIEHRIDIALPFADYVYVMDRGKVIAEGLPDEVANNPKVIEIYIGE